MKGDKNLMGVEISDPVQYPSAIIGLRPSLLLKGEVGVFALRTLAEETIINRAEDFDESVVISWSSFRLLDHTTKQRLRMFCWQSKDGIHAPRNINHLTIAWHINHSCKPNVYIDKTGSYRTLHAVKRGEELFIDIGTIMTNPQYRLKCRCGESNCVGIVKPRWPDTREHCK